MKEPHTALFVAPTGVRKTDLALDLLEKEYINHFDFIIIICPTLKHNDTYRHRNWIRTDPEVILIEPGKSQYNWIEKIGNLLGGSETLFFINDIIANETLNKRRQPIFVIAEWATLLVDIHCPRGGS